MRTRSKLKRKKATVPVRKRMRGKYKRLKRLKNG